MDNVDPQTLRWILGVTGAFVILGIYVWGQHRQKLLDFITQRGEFDELESDVHPPAKEPPHLETTGGIGGGMSRKEVEQPVTFKAPEVAELPKAQEKPIPAKPAEKVSAPRETARNASLGAPFLIQISVVANGEDNFNGLQLRDALEDLRLIYGDMGNYHRYDRDYRVPLFSVASLVEPGTFPIKDMENFDCPGVVLFFQPPQVDDPLAVFDDLVTTCHELALRLGGVEWDEKRQHLSLDKITQMRERLTEAY